MHTLARGGGGGGRGAHKCLGTVALTSGGQGERFRLRKTVVLLAFFVMVSCDDSKIRCCQW